MNSLDGGGGGGISYNAIRSAILEKEKTMKIDAKSNRRKGEVYIPISLIGGEGKIMKIKQMGNRILSNM